MVKLKNKKVLGAIVALAFLGTSGCCTLRNKTLFEYNIDGKADVKYELVNSPLEYRSNDPDYKMIVITKDTGKMGQDAGIKSVEWVIVDDNRDGRINLEADDYVIVKAYDKSNKIVIDEKYGKSNPDQKALEFFDMAYVVLLNEIRDKLPEGEKDKFPKPNTH